MKLLLIRHGETALNVSRVLQPAATPLSERGHAQAAALARRLAGFGLAGIVSSDLPRASQTAEPLARISGLPLTTSVLLRERDFGLWRGQAYDGLDCDPLTMTEAPPGGESLAEFERRVATAFDWLLTQQAALGGPLAVVSHGLVLKTLLLRHACCADGRTVGNALATAGLRNTCLSILPARAPHQIELLACTAHLTGKLNEPAHSLSGG